MTRISQHPVADIPLRGGMVEFVFDGTVMEGRAGEAVSSALYANGVRVFSEHHKNGKAQGIFCANGQCSQCSVLVNGISRKACVTPLEAGMDIRTLRGAPLLPRVDGAELFKPTAVYGADALVVGAGPSGLSAALELSALGFSVILVDDKEKLGGKLLLQTHKFFGSEEDCYAGTRGYDIAALLEKKIRADANIQVLTNSPVIGIYKDKKAGVYIDYKRYGLIDFKAVLVAAGARERSVLFPGNDLPGVYGAGAFQTLVNRDFIKAAEKVFIVGSGNVGLIAAYHALQAGIQVAGICEIMPKINGYKVHADKIVRMGVPIYFNTGVVSVEGAGKVERITIANVDEAFNPILDTARTFALDTVLLATGLSPCNELFRQAVSFGFPAVKAGDTEEIAEASSAMFGGKISARSLAKKMGMQIEVNPSWEKKREVLKSRPGDIIRRAAVRLDAEWRPVFFCDEEIPCNPCTTVCPAHAINLQNKRDSIMDMPYYDGHDCKACSACVAACPGLAVSLARRLDDKRAEVKIPFEFDASAHSTGDKLAALDQSGAFVCDAELVDKKYFSKYKTWVLTLRAKPEDAARIIGVRIQAESVTRPLPSAVFDYIPDNAVVCRCEGIHADDIVRFIKENDVRDVNQLKSLRVGMGACGSKTCSVLLPALFKKAGADPSAVAGGTLRPLMVEIPLGELAAKGGRA